MVKPYPQGFFQDHFDDNSTDATRWLKLQTTGGTVSEKNQHVEVKITRGSGWAQTGYVTAETYRLFEHTVSVNASNGNLSEMTLQICGVDLPAPPPVTSSDPYNQDNWYRIQKLRDGSFNVQQKIQGVVTTTPYTGTGNKLQITVKTDPFTKRLTIYFSDGSPLQIWGPYSLTSENCYIYIFTSSNRSTAYGTGSFDNFDFKVIPTTFDESRIDDNCYTGSSPKGGQGVTTWGPRPQDVHLPPLMQAFGEKQTITFPKPKCYSSKDVCNVTFKLHTNPWSVNKSYYGPIWSKLKNEITSVEGEAFPHYLSGMGGHDAIVTHDIAMADQYSEGLNSPQCTTGKMSISFKNDDPDVDVWIQGFQVTRGYGMRTLDYQGGDQCRPECTTDNSQDFDTNPQDYPCNFHDCGGMSLTTWRDNHFFDPIAPNGHQVWGTILRPGNTYSWNWTNPSATFEGFNNYVGKSHCILNFNNVHLCDDNGYEVDATVPEVIFLVSLNNSPWVTVYHSKRLDNTPFSFDLATHETFMNYYNDTPGTTNTLQLQYPNNPNPGVNLYFVDGDSGLINIYRFYRTKPCCPTITSGAVGSGTISPWASINPIPIPEEGQPFTMSPPNNLTDVKVDGVSKGAINPFTVTWGNINIGLGMEGHSILAYFYQLFHTITASCNDYSRGYISPAGAVTVADGQSQNFTIAATCGQIADVIIDQGTGSEQHLGPQSSPYVYTFNSVTSDHTIAAVLSVIPDHGPIILAVEGVAVTPANVTFTIDGANYAPGAIPCLTYAKHTFSVDPTTSDVYGEYTFEYWDVLDGGANHIRYEYCNPLSLELTTSTQFLVAKYTTNPTQLYTVSASCGPNGTITPSSAVIAQASCATFDLSPNGSYHIDDVLLNGNTDYVNVAGNQYTANGVQGDSSVYATFSQQYRILATAGNNGSITPPGNVYVDPGGSQSFTIQANSGYQILDVVVDGVSQGPISSYPFTNVQSNRTISASFAVSCGSCVTCQGCQGCVTCQSCQPCEVCQTCVDCYASCYDCQSCYGCQSECYSCQQCQTGCQVCQPCETCQPCENCQTGCEVSCETGCEVNCEVGCEVSCEDTCQTSCQDTCQLSCQDTCQLSCQVGCEVSCQSCNTCQDTCQLSCQTGCQVSCQDTCQLSCQTGCEVSCQVGCQVSCQETCQLACQTGCEVSCQSCQPCETCQTCMDCYGSCYDFQGCYYCQSSCYDCEACQFGCQVCQPCQNCQSGCEVSCQESCQISCQEVCQLACQNCQSGCEVSCQAGCELCEGACQPGCFMCQDCQTNQ